MKVLLAGLEPAEAERFEGWLREKGHKASRCGAGEERLAANRVAPDMVVGRFDSPAALDQFTGWLRARHRLVGTRVMVVMASGGGPMAWVRAGAGEVVLADVSRGDFEMRLELLAGGGILRVAAEGAAAEGVPDWLRGETRLAAMLVEGSGRIVAASAEAAGFFGLGPEGLKERRVAELAGGDSGLDVLVSEAAGGTAGHGWVCAGGRGKSIGRAAAACLPARRAGGSHDALVLLLPVQQDAPPGESGQSAAESRSLRKRQEVLERDLAATHARLERSLAELAAERKRTAELSLVAGRVDAIESSMAELTARLGEEHARAGRAAEAGAGAAAEALAKAHSELSSLRIELDEARQLPSKLAAAIGGGVVEGIVLVDARAEGSRADVLYANPVLQRWLGKRAQEIEGRPLWFGGAEHGIDWGVMARVSFVREESARDAAGRKLRVEAVPVAALGEGRTLWALVFNEAVADVIRSAEAGGKPAGFLRRVLLARDGGPVNPRLAGVLRDGGFQVVLAEPNSGIIEKLQPGDCDMAVLEINRPGSAGSVILRQIRQRVPAEKIMVVGRLLTLRQKLEVAKEGAGEVVTSDLSGPEFLERADRLLGTGGVPGAKP